MIDSFKGEYRWLSNFWPAEVWFEGDAYPSVEHAYQAAKTTSLDIRKKIAAAPTAAKAKQMGKRLTRPGWENDKVTIMRYLTIQKYTDTELREKLIATGAHELVEGNTWGDTFWGVCDGVGTNYLGKILMEVRDMCKQPVGAVYA